MFSVAEICTVLVLAGSFALTFGLTYLPCYSAICVEQHFPLNVRIHLGAFYGFILAALVIHTAYRKVPLVNSSLNSRISSHHVPFTTSHATWGGLLTVVGLAAFVAACQGYFWGDEKQFYEHRGLTEANTTLGTTRLAIVGTTGHMCDFLLGLIILPISRDSILRTTFKIETAHLLWFHKFVGYFLFLVVCIHTIFFYSWVPVFAKAEMPLKDVFGIDNPTMAQHEVDENAYYATVLASGMISFVIFIAIIITSVPKRIRQNYNTFYYVHGLSILFFILTAIHASTDFYLLLPGLLLWLVDWFNRIRGLRYSMEAQLQKESNEWYRLVIPRSNLPKRMIKLLERESDWPLKHFYLNIPSISKWQNHPYTTASATGTQDIVWLFRVSNLGKKEKDQRKEWTVKLAKLVSEDRDTAEIELGSNVDAISSAALQSRINALPSRMIRLRLSPPYSIPINPFAMYDHVICIVGGTGITGALSLANTFLELHSNSESRRKCITRSLHIVWSIRQSDDADLLDIQAVLEDARIKNVSLTFNKFLTGGGRGRLNFEQTLIEATNTEKPGRAWVYFSGPNAFMSSGENACVARKKLGTAIEWHSAKWDV